MGIAELTPKQVQIVALRETAGSALYGMVDVLSAAGNIWQTLTRRGQQRQLFDVSIVAATRAPFTCGNGIPVNPDLGVDSNPSGQIIIIPEMWVGPDEDLLARYSAVLDWIRHRYQEGATVYSACSGAIILAATGLLDGKEATSHWGYQDLFRQQFPKVSFCPEPNMVFADPAGRIVTAGGTSSWHDLAIHIIARHANPGEAMRVAKVYLMKIHTEGQLPYATLVRPVHHGDSVVKRCEQWLAENYQHEHAVSEVVALSQLPERTIKRRFKSATGCSVLDYLQNLRIEKAKHLLESTDKAVEEISVEVSYEDASFFRRLFKRRTGLSPGQYRRMFKPVSLVVTEELLTA